jgi:hypothetical protein
MMSARIYAQFDADQTREFPAEGFRGWQSVEIPIDLDHTALVVMHAWDTGNSDQYPGWYRHVEYLPRANRICHEIFPPLFKVIRASGMPIFHVVGGGHYYQQYPGYQRAVQLTKKGHSLQGMFDPKARIGRSQTRKKIDEIRAKYIGGGDHNRADIEQGINHLNFAPNAFPVGEEGIAENSPQLFALCKSARVDHLIYVGFAINWCLLLSPGGMAEMSKLGLLCSTISEATTAVENDFSARTELAKQIALWRIGLAFGFVFNQKDFLAGLGFSANE